MIISCSYKKRVGKDTLFYLAKEIYPEKNIIRVAFADELKTEVEELFLKPYGFDKLILDDLEKKDVFRPIMQGWGSFRRELFDKNYWVNLAIEKMKDEDAIYIITDARYLNEILYLKNLGATTIHIKRDLENKEHHSSETELDEYHHLFDYTIDNNGSIDDFKNKIKNVMEKLV